MIGRLRGTFLGTNGNVATVECGGIGYVATVSAYTQASLPAVGSEVILRVFTHALESKISLYGFGGDDERALFDLLITVKNVGPSSAMGILSGGANPQEIAQLIASGDASGLKKLPGVGKKTAELLVVELRDKCELLLATWGASAAPATSSPRAGGKPRIVQDVASALTGLGFRSAEFDKVLNELPIAPDSTVEGLLRTALRSLGR